MHVDFERDKMMYVHVHVVYKVIPMLTCKHVNVMITLCKYIMIL